MKLNKNTKVGVLSFIYTDNFIDSVIKRELEEFISQKYYWEEVFNNELLENEEMDYLEDLYDLEYSHVKKCLKEALYGDEENEIILTTRKNDKEIIKTNLAEKYKYCSMDEYSICVEQESSKKIDVPKEKLINNIVTLEKERVAKIKGSVEYKILTEVCYNLIDMLEYLYFLSHEDAVYNGKIRLTEEEQKRLRNLLVLEYSVYSYYIQNS